MDLEAQKSFELNGSPANESSIAQGVKDGLVPRQPTTNSLSSTRALNEPQPMDVSFKTYVRKLMSCIPKGLPYRRFRRRSKVKIQLKVRKISRLPKGYPDVATFLDSDENFMVFRRFGWVQTRLLLEKQWKMARLEQKLEDLDQKDNKEDPRRLETRSVVGQAAVEREGLFQQLEAQYNQYATLMDSALRLTSMKPPSSADYRSITNYFHSYQPLWEKDQEWVQWKEDLVTLKPGREHAWLDDAIEHLLRIFNSPFLNAMFRSKETLLKSEENEDGVYYTRRRIDLLVSGIIALMILVLLIVPIYVLFRLIMNSGPDLDGRTVALCIAILIVFTLAFSAVLSLFTRARRHEILAAAAAYCAVLVVFFGNVKPGT